MALRRTGRTTSAILSTPKNGVYVVHGQDFIPYCKQIAKDFGREDVEFATVQSISNLSRFRGRRVHLTVDHFVWEESASRGVLGSELVARLMSIIQGRGDPAEFATEGFSGHT